MGDQIHALPRAEHGKLQDSHRHTRNPLVGAYLTPLNLDHPPDFEEELQRLKGMVLIVLGGLKVDLDKYRILRSQCVADLLTEFGIIDLVRNFRQRRRFQDLNTWTQVRQGAVLRSSCNYILGTDQCRFKLIGIWDMHNYMSDPFAIWARLLSLPT